MNTEKNLWKEGAEAYMDGKKPEDNPFDAFESAKHFSAWQHGYRMEQQYWEMAGQEADDAFLRI